MKRVILISFSAIIVAAQLFATGATVDQLKNDPDKKEWIQLFNRKDLKDWDIKISGYDLNDNFGNTFRVEEGLLKVSYDKYDTFKNRFGHIFYREKFSNYV
ncbi:MAG: DUF1080 domain-containing protein, partial [Blastocatellia bacterium]|nr:DUF1080 domain-containing protein [Blastocatellia bacterium]